VNAPPTITFDPEIEIEYADPLRPVPRADHLVPSHLATLLAETPPIEVKSPAT
jgi:hypothetical protein